MERCYLQLSVNRECMHTEGIVRYACYMYFIWSNSTYKIPETSLYEENKAYVRHTWPWSLMINFCSLCCAAAVSEGGFCKYPWTVFSAIQRIIGYHQDITIMSECRQDITIMSECRQDITIMSGYHNNRIPSGYHNNRIPSGYHNNVRIPSGYITIIGY